MARKLRMGMVGGGRDAFIGAVHRMAAWLDGKIDLVAGAFSANAEKSRLSGEDLGLDPKRVYPDYETMAKTEAGLPKDQRIDFVSIVTPNHAHFPVAKTFLEAGFNVVCDKPMTFDLAEAIQLRDLVKKTGKVFALTHNYTGYPMVKEAREMVRKGELGKILKVVAEYPQGWLIQPIDAEGKKGAAWRTDPSKAGASSAIGDIGTHAENLGRYITGLEIEELCAEFTTFVPGRRLEDDGNLLLRYRGGAKGVLCASQISSRRRERSQHSSVRNQSFVGMASGTTERADREISRRTAQNCAAGQRIRQRGGKEVYAIAVWTSGSVHRSICKHLPGSCSRN